MDAEEGERENAEDMQRERGMVGPGENVLQATRPRGRRRKKRSLRWATLNAQSLGNKMSLLRKRAFDYKPHILSVTETFGKEWLNDAFFNIEKYTMYRRDRTGKKGGGTILYIRDGVEHRVSRVLKTEDFESSAWCWIV